MSYVDYYDIENYLFLTVHERFRKDGYIRSSDFFSIVRWKSNRPKRMIRNDLLKERCPDLDEAVKSLTRDIHEADGHENRLKILMRVRGIGVAMATASLTVLHPDYFTVYDTRVCEQLGSFSNLGSRSISTTWEGLRGVPTGGSGRSRQEWGSRESLAAGHGSMAMDSGCGRSAEEGGVYSTHRSLNSVPVRRGNIVARGPSTADRAALIRFGSVGCPVSAEDRGAAGAGRSGVGPDRRDDAGGRNDARRQ